MPRPPHGSEEEEEGDEVIVGGRCEIEMYHS